MPPLRPVAALGVTGLAALAWLTWAGDEGALAVCVVETVGKRSGPPGVTADGRIVAPGVDPGPRSGSLAPSEVLLDRPASDPLWDALRAWEAAHPSARVRYVRSPSDPRRTCDFDEDMQGFVGEAPCVARERVEVRVRAQRPWSRDVEVSVATEAPDYAFSRGATCFARRSWRGWRATFGLEWAT